LLACKLVKKYPLVYGFIATSYISIQEIFPGDLTKTFDAAQGCLQVRFCPERCSCAEEPKMLFRTVAYNILIIIILSNLSTKVVYRCNKLWQVFAVHNLKK